MKAGSHEQRKRKDKRKEVHASNLNASTLKYTRATEEYPKMADEVHALGLRFFLHLGLRLIRRRRQIQSNNRTEPKRVGFEKSFEKDNLRRSP